MSDAPTEYAGEVRDVFHQTKVTVVHGGRLLLNDFMPDKFRRAMEEDLRAAGADVILDDYVDGSIKDGVVKTRSGKVVEADLLVSCQSFACNVQCDVKTCLVQ